MKEIIHISRFYVQQKFTQVCALHSTMPIYGKLDGNWTLSLKTITSKGQWEKWYNFYLTLEPILGIGPPKLGTASLTLCSDKYHSQYSSLRISLIINILISLYSSVLCVTSVKTIERNKSTT